MITNGELLLNHPRFDGVDTQLQGSDLPLSEAFSSLLESGLNSPEPAEVAQVPMLPIAPAGPAIAPNILNLPGLGKMVGNLSSQVKNAIQGHVEQQLPTKVDEAMTTLANHNLRGSFLAHAKDQLERYGKIYVGVIDNFNPDESTHGEGVARRIKATAPDYLRDHVEIVPFDVSGGKINDAYQNAIRAAQDKDIVALSVSGGLEAVHKEGLEHRMGIDEIGPDNRQTAFWTGMSNFKSEPDYEQLQKNMMGISTVSRSIPVVTPIWNRGSTTLPAIAGAGIGGPIVTSIEEKYGDTHRTEGPRMVDFEAPLPSNPAVRNTHTSQSAPYFIGQILGGISEQEVREILRN